MVTREQKAIGKWLLAKASAENYTIDPHTHIALLVEAGEQMAALLTPEGAAALASPETLPPVAVGDVVEWEWKSGRERVFQRIHTEIGAETWNTKLRDKLLGHYRPLWRRGKE